MHLYYHRFKEVKHLHQQPIIQDGRNKESTIDGKTRRHDSFEDVFKEERFMGCSPLVHFIEIIRMLLYCRKYLLFISKEKSEMVKTEVDFLGFHIHRYGIYPRAVNVRGISELHEPRNTKEAEAVLEFNNLKKEFESENIVAIPIEQDNTIPIDIEKVKASTYMSIHSDNNNLNNSSFHLYCDVKFLSIIDSLKKFQHLLIGKKVSIYTDHQNLTYIINKSNDKPFTKRQDNYMKYIKEFDYENLRKKNQFSMAIRDDI
ncbi:hypothetical protein ACTFIR_007514 [Dictyostelium discoideum]